MLANELIKVLQKMVKEVGDLPVYTSSRNDWDDMEVSGIKRLDEETGDFPDESIPERFFLKT